MSRTIVDVHVLQTVPPSNLNRDDTGSPKSATFGGVRRARVSSQAWKRATRTAFADLLTTDELGVRSKRVVELLGEAIRERDTSLAEGRAQELATAVLAATGDKGIALKPSRQGKDAPQESTYLVFFSRRQIENLADLAVAAAGTDGKPTIDKKEAKARADREHSVDVALFGRMVADDTALNVDAACQVAHAISVHGVANEYDYFTAVDDHKNADEDEDAGAGMIGTVEFNSSTLYRYATVDVDRLRDNLGDADATRRAVEAFVRAFVMSMPTGKQNTFANRTLPDAVYVVVRESQPINLVGAYETAVDQTTGRVAEAVRLLAKHAGEQHDAFDETPVASWCVGGPVAQPLAEDSEQVSMNALVDAVGATVAERSS